jgi:acetylornithine deacetylase
MTVIDAHKSIDVYRTRVTGKEAHSSLPALGVNAISVAAELIGEIDRAAEKNATTENDPRFEPSYSTVSVGTIDGGTATNIVPKTCEFSWQVRGLPTAPAGEAARDLAAFAERDLLPKMRKLAENAAIETETQTSVPAFIAAPNSDAVAFALALTGANRAEAVSYATEAGLFEKAGCPAVICGPGDIAQAHAADEFVSIVQIEACMKFLEDLADQLSH